MAGVIGALLLEQHTKRHQAYSTYQQNAERDRRAASEEIAEACDDRTGDAFRLCIAEHVETYYRDQATNQDLQAQQDMAYWAGALFFSSTILTGVGIYLLWGTLAASRETLSEAHKTTAASIIGAGASQGAAEAAIAANEFANETRQLELQPYLEFSDVVLEDTNVLGHDIYFSFACTIENFGRTHARGVYVQGSGNLMFNSVNLVIDPIKQYWVKMDSDVHSIGAEAKGVFKFSVRGKIDFDPAVVQITNVDVKGDVFYSDIFSDPGSRDDTIRGYLRVWGSFARLQDSVGLPHWPDRLHATFSELSPREREFRALARDQRKQ